MNENSNSIQITLSNGQVINTTIRRAMQKMCEVVDAFADGNDKLTADRDLWRDRCERLIGHYGGHEKWVLDHLTTDSHKHDEHCIYDLFTGNRHGYSFAQQIQQEINDDAN